MTSEIQKTNALLIRNTTAAIERLSPLKSRDGSIEVHFDNVKIDPADFDPSGFNRWQQARIEQGTIGAGITADVSLFRDGKPAGAVKGKRLGVLPLKGGMRSFMVGGNDYFAKMQSRQKPGVYVRQKSTGDYEAFIPVQGAALRLWMEPSTGRLHLQQGTTNVDWYPIMSALGVSESDMLEALGRDQRAQELLDINKKFRGSADSQVDKLYRSVFKEKTDRDMAKANLAARSDVSISDPAAQIAAIRDWMSNKRVDPFVTKRTLGTEYRSLSTDLLLKATRKVLGVVRGEMKEDDRESPEYRSIHATDDMLPERITRAGSYLGRVLLTRLGKPGVSLAQAMGPNWLDPVIRGYFSGGPGGFGPGLVATAEAANPLAVLGEDSKVTLTGDGGIQSSHAITASVRLTRPVATNFYDPVHTPEGSSIGVDTHLAVSARKEGNTLVSSYYPITLGVRGRERVDRTLEQAADATVGYPEYWDKDGRPVDKLVRAIRGGDIVMVPPKEVDLVIPSGLSMFDTTSNAALLLGNTHANRAMMVGKHISQALPLVHREVAHIALTDDQDHDVHQSIGALVSVHSTVDGKVTKIEPGGVWVGDTQHEMFDDYPMQSKVPFTHTPVVKVGDTVKKGDLLADSNYTKGGVLALGVGLRSAYMPWRNAANFEDAIVVSESAANKLTSEHLHRKQLYMRDDNVVLGRQLYAAQFPTKLTQTNLAKLDENGIVKAGQRVEPGDTLIAAVKKREFTGGAKDLGQIHKKLLRPYADAAVVWTEDYPGEVVRAVRQDDGVEVHVRTFEPARIGDKLSMSSAAKGTISTVVPDEEMPHTKDGEHMEVIFNPQGIGGRMNPSQTIEQALGKWSKKTGKQYRMQNMDGSDIARVTQQLLKDEGLKHSEILHDPVTGKDLERPVGVGYNYVFKLDHPVRKKFSARERDGYTMDETPTVGRGKGGQSVDHLSTYALLGHNAHAILGEHFGIRGAKNDDYWAAYQAGETPPPPRVPFVFEKFRAYLHGAGIDTQERGNILHYLPMTEKRVLAMSNGAISRPAQLKARTLKEETGGLFDPKITGGLHGENWAHIDLGMRIPHPLYEKVIRDVADISSGDYLGLIAHTRFLNPKTGKFGDGPDGITGEEAFKHLLAFDPSTKLDEIRDRMRTAVGSDRNRLHRTSQYVRGLQKTGLTADEAYLTRVVPVVPPKYRGVIEMPGGALQVHDSNTLYRDIILAKDAVAGTKALPKADQAKARITVYDAFAGLVGVGKPLTERRDMQELSGFVDIIRGKSNKMGLFQRQISRRRADYTGRSTIEPDASLGVDEIGLPEEMCWKIYKPAIVRRLRQLGWAPAMALSQVEKQTPAARQALEAELGSRPVTYTRAPAIHRFSVLAANARMVPGKEIKISPLVVGPFNADYDGNCCIGSSILTVMFHGAKCTIPTAEVINETLEGSVVRIRIDEMPHFVESVRRDRNGAYVYDVPSGISVLTADASGAGTRFSAVTKFTVEDGCRLVEVRTTSGKSVVVSDNESLAIYDSITGVLVRRRPEDSLGGFCAVACSLRPTLVEEVEIDDPLDTVPVPWWLVAYANDAEGTFKDALEIRTALCSPQPALSRLLALQAAGILEREEVAGAQDWCALVRDLSVTWERVASVEERPSERVYDLEVPENKVFAVNDGLVIYDTMAVLVPLTEKAKKESFGLLPSKNLFYDRDRSLAFAPDKDIIVGIFALTRTGQASGKSYNSADEAIAAYEANKDNLRMDSIVTVKGEPGRPTIGWLLFKRVVPAQFLGAIAPPIDKKKLMSVIEAVAKQQPSTFNLLTRRIAQLGFNSAAAAGGITATVDELVYNRSKVDRLLKGLADKIHTGKTLEEKRRLAEKHFAEDVQKPLQADVLAHLEKHDAGFADLVRSGATGKIDQFVQIFASPVLVRDIDGNVVPTVIHSSYGGGMTPSDFILTTPGARAGMIDRSLSTSKPGFLAKEVAASMGPIRIGERDCRTKRFIEVELSEPDVDLLDRHLAEDIAGAKRNDAVTPALLAVLRLAKVKALKVRSPMTCEAQSPPCQMCAGRDASGELHQVGANIGLNYGQAMSERTTQLIMKCSAGLVRTGNGVLPWSVYFSQHAEQAEDGGVTRASVAPQEKVEGRNGPVEVLEICRHLPTAPVKFVTVRSGAGMLVQEDHPLLVCRRLRPGHKNSVTRLLGENAYRCSSSTPRDFRLDAQGADVVTVVARDVTTEDAIWVDYRPLLRPDCGYAPGYDPYILGLYAGDGGVRYGNGTPRYEGVPVAAYFTLKGEKWAEIDRRVERFYQEVSSGVSGSVRNIYSPALAAELSALVQATQISSTGRRAGSKVLAADVAGIDRAWLTEYLAGLIDSDGHLFIANGTTVINITSTSIEQVLQIQAICRRLGLHGKISIVDDCPCREEQWRTAFTIAIRFREDFFCSSIKLFSKGPILPFKHALGTAICGFDTVERSDTLSRWEGFVYDVKTQTGEYMAGCVQNHNSFHTGGSIGSGPTIHGGFQRVQELLRAPSSLPNQGALSDVNGKVTKVVNAPQGGQYVHILSADDDTDIRQQYVGQGLKTLVGPGDHVSVGDPLSEGSYLPQEIAAKKGMLAAQRYVVEQAHQAYRDAGVTMRKPVIEVVVAGSMRYVEITDSGGDPDLVPGDVLHENEFARRRKDHPGMQSKPTIPGLSKKPLVTSNDLLERLNFQRLETAMHEVPASAGYSDLTGVNSPIPGLAYGAKFRPGG